MKESIKLEEIVPILGVGVCVEMDELVGEYSDYIIDLNIDLNNKNYIEIGNNNRDFSFMDKYKIDKYTHLSNLSRLRYVVEEYTKKYI